MGKFNYPTFLMTWQLPILENLYCIIAIVFPDPLTAVGIGAGELLNPVAFSLVVLLSESNTVIYMAIA